MKLSVVVPCYNERASILELLGRVLAVPLAKEVIVVDDGSIDGTSELLRDFRDPSVRVIFGKRNLGKSAALAEGFRHVSGDVIVIQDADLEYNPRDYAAMLAPIESGTADVVYGSRFGLGTGFVVRHYWHGVANRVLTSISNLLYGLELTDMETGYKMFRADLLERFDIRSSGFVVEPELTAKFARLGCRFLEVPVSYRARSYAEGKKIGWRDGFRALFGLVYFRLFD